MDENQSITPVEMHEEVPNLHEVNPHVVVQGLNHKEPHIWHMLFTSGMPRTAVLHDIMMAQASFRAYGG